MRKNIAEQEVEKSNMKEPMTMARLVWTASEPGSATGFAKEPIIPQKPPVDEESEC